MMNYVLIFFLCVCGIANCVDNNCEYGSNTVSCFCSKGGVIELLHDVFLVELQGSSCACRIAYVANPPFVIKHQNGRCRWNCHIKINKTCGRFSNKRCII